MLLQCLSVLHLSSAPDTKESNNISICKIYHKWSIVVCLLMYPLTVHELKACQKVTGCNIWMNKNIPCLSFQVLLLLCKQSLSLPQQRRTKVPTKDSIKVHKRFQKAGPKGKKINFFRKRNNMHRQQYCFFFRQEWKPPQIWKIYLRQNGTCYNNILLLYCTNV